MAKINPANIITGFRVVCSAALLFCRPLSAAFYLWYAAGGFTDMIDGAVARKMNTVSTFGSQLDTAADAVFVAVCLIRLLPVLDVPLWLSFWITVIALIRVVNVVSGFMMQKKLVVLHTVMNKVTGLLLFALPFLLPFFGLKTVAPVVCAAATFAAVQEGHCIRTGKESF